MLMINLIIIWEKQKKVYFLERRVKVDRDRGPHK